MVRHQRVEDGLPSGGVVLRQGVVALAEQMDLAAGLRHSLAEGVVELAGKRFSVSVIGNSSLFVFSCIISRNCEDFHRERHNIPEKFTKKIE